MAMMQSVSRSVAASPRCSIDLLTCSMEAIRIPPLEPILHPFSTRVLTEVLNWREERGVSVGGGREGGKGRWNEGGRRGGGGREESSLARL